MTFSFLSGNTVSLVVFLTTYLNRLSHSIYMAALAISDSGFLIGSFISMFSNFFFEVLMSFFFIDLISCELISVCASLFTENS